MSFPPVKNNPAPKPALKQPPDQLIYSRSAHVESTTEERPRSGGERAQDALDEVTRSLDEYKLIKGVLNRWSTNSEVINLLSDAISKLERIKRALRTTDTVTVFSPDLITAEGHTEWVSE
jgi:hypothetical protein